MDDPKRGTGRTTRLMARALIDALQNPSVPVIFVVHTAAMRSYVRPLATDLCDGDLPANFSICSHREVSGFARWGLSLRRARFHFDHYQGD